MDYESKITDDVAFENYKKYIMAVAKELKYPDKIMERLSEAGDDKMCDRIMHDAREQCMRD